MSRFEDQVVLITGGGRGIGAATARIFAREGARVALAARTREEVDAVAADIDASGERAMALVADVSSETDVATLFEEVEARWGRPHHLVNNAGMVGKAALADLTPATWDRVMAVNLRGPYLCTRAFLADRPKELGGSIVNVASISGVAGPPKFAGFAAYGASKAGLILFTEVAASEARELGVRVNAVSPGSTDTVMLREAAPGVEPDLTPEQVAAAIVHLCSDEASGVTGANLNVWG